MKDTRQIRMRYKHMNLSYEQVRGFALGAVRSYCREHTIPMVMSADDAVKVLDDMVRADSAPQKCYWALWYRAASETQIALFKREWRKYQKELALRETNLKYTFILTDKA